MSSIYKGESFTNQNAILTETLITTTLPTVSKHIWPVSHTLMYSCPVSAVLVGILASCSKISEWNYVL